jgi:hypothetical protein
MAKQQPPLPKSCMSRQRPASVFYDTEPPAQLYCRKASGRHNRHMVASLGRMGLVTGRRGVSQIAEVVYKMRLIGIAIFRCPGEKTEAPSYLRYRNAASQCFNGVLDTTIDTRLEMMEKQVLKNAEFRRRRRCGQQSFAQRPSGLVPSVLEGYDLVAKLRDGRRESWTVFCICHSVR